MFAIVLLDASIIGAAAVTLATSYAFGDVFGLKHSLHRGFADAKQFYLSYTRDGGGGRSDRADPRRSARADHHRGAGPGRPAVAQRQRVSAAVVQRPGSVGAWVNRPWLNWLAGLIVAVLLLLSGILMATTLFPNLDVVSTTEYLVAAMIVLVVLAVGALKWFDRRRAAPAASRPVHGGPDKMQWRMPPLALLEPVTWSAGTKMGMLALRGYLLVGAILLIVKAVQLGGR